MDYTAALPQFQTVLDLAGFYAEDADYYKARANYKLGNYQTALDLFTAFPTTYPLSTMADNAQFWIGRSNYKLLQYTAARAAFNTLMTTYPLSTLYDAANYWIGRSHYIEGLDYPAALAAFDATILLAGNYADNAQYYIGKTLYMQLDNIGARAAFDAVLVTYPATLLVDNVNYWLGRVSLVVAEVAAVEADFGPVATLFSDFIVNYPTSTFVDNAHYYIGRTHHKLATLELFNTDQAAAVNSFDAARVKYQYVIDTFLTSVYLDNSHYYIGKSYHEQQNCTPELVEMQFVADYYPPTSYYQPFAQTHVTAINTNDAAHPCP